MENDDSLDLGATEERRAFSTVGSAGRKWSASAPARPSVGCLLNQSINASFSSKTKTNVSKTNTKMETKNEQADRFCIHDVIINIEKIKKL